MSARFRRKRQALLVAATPADAGNDQAWSGELDMQYPTPADLFPGPREHRVTDAMNGPEFTLAQMSIHDNIDWEVGGNPGATKNAYSTGVVDPSNVDAHDYDGGQAIVRRMRDTNFGDVGTADYNSTLALVFQMSEADQYFPNETSQADLILGV